MLDGTPMPSNPREPTGKRESGLRQRAGAPIIFRPTPCGSCGYELLGLPQNGVCPECGTRVGEDAPPGAASTGTRPAEPAPTRKPACHHCGYDLTGLEPGSACPECGTLSIAGVPGAARDTLGDSEPGYLAGLAAGLLLSAGAGLGYLYLTFVGSITIGSLGALVSFIGACAAAWFVGVMLMLRQRPGGGRDREIDIHGREWWRLRLFIGVTQASLLLACGVEIIDILSGAAAVGGGARGGAGAGAGGIGTGGTVWLAGIAWGGWRWIDWALTVIGVAGWPPLCYYLARLADWAPDDSLTRWFRHTGSFIGVGILVAGVALLARQFAPLRILVFFASSLLLIFPLACLCMILLMLRFVWTVGWARRNTIERWERDARMAARARQRAEAMAARSFRATGLDRPPAPQIDHTLLASLEAANAAPPGTSPWTDEDLEAQRRASTATHTLKPSEDRSGYALEDDTGPAQPR